MTSTICGVSGLQSAMVVVWSIVVMVLNIDQLKLEQEET